MLKKQKNSNKIVSLFSQGTTKSSERLQWWPKWDTSCAVHASKTSHIAETCGPDLELKTVFIKNCQSWPTRSLVYMAQIWPKPVKATNGPFEIWFAWSKSIPNLTMPQMAHSQFGLRSQNLSQICHCHKWPIWNLVYTVKIGSKSINVNTGPFTVWCTSLKSAPNLSMP